MKKILIILLSLLFFSCSRNTKKPPKKSDDAIESNIVAPIFQTIIDSAQLEGSILIYDLEKGQYYSNDYKWNKKQHLPASTFKITNSIIALETGVVENDSTLFKWDGEQRMLKSWEQDLILRDAFHFSCVPCYQEVARKIGAKRMNTYLNKLEYGNMKVDTTTIDMFWLEGESRINQFEQIDFLKRFYLSQLPISKRTEKIMKRMIVIDDNDHYKLSGKTGWSITDEINNGWFVGYLETSDNVYFFATNVEPTEQFDMSTFPKIRKDITYEAFKQLKIIK